MVSQLIPVRQSLSRKAASGSIRVNPPTRLVPLLLERMPIPSLTINIILLLFLLLSFFQLPVQAQDPVKNFCRRFGHQTAVIDRTLYIDGGLVNWNPIVQYPANYSNRGLLYQDLNKNSPDGMPQLYANLTKNSSIPSVSGGILWADNVNKRFYLFGGEYYLDPPAPSFSLFSFDALANQWDNFGIPTQTSIKSVSFGAGVAISERGEGYYYGGWLSNNSVFGWTGPSVATSGLIKYNMDTNSWTNNTGPDTVRRAEGAMVYIPAGDGGMLIYFGGVTDPYANGSYVGQPMSKILIYDVLSSKWYTQAATGTIPGMRRRFCAGATWAPDQSSYNIYLYGGASMPPNTSGFDDVYILTIPTFTWIKLYPTDGNITGQYPHHSLTCNVISGAQMLIIGGTFPLSDDCDVPAQWGTHNLDMGQQNADKATWQLFVPNLNSYAVPDPIINVVGGNSKGGAAKTAPASGFDAPDLKVLMTRKATIAATRTPTRAIPGPSSSSSGTPSPGTALSTGAIVGIAVGGAAVLIAALACCVWCLRRHRRRRRQYPSPAPAVSVASYDPPPGSSWTPTSSPYPPSPMLARRPTLSPVELPVPGGNIWRDENGVAYQMRQSADNGLSRSGTFVSGGSATMVGTEQQQYKVDEQGRVWVPVSSPGRSPVVDAAGFLDGHGRQASVGSVPGRGGGGTYTHQLQELSSSPPAGRGPLGELSSSPPPPGVDDEREREGTGQQHHQTYYHR